jgi:hypothetical protein
MCEISENIKFCTCSSDSIDNLKHYWLLYRYDENKDGFILGRVILPSYYRDQNFKINQSTILERLNNGDGFDKMIEFKAKDIFEVGINRLEDATENSFYYQFVFKKGKWHPTKSNTFDLINNYNKVTFGKLKTPFIKPQI